MVATAVANTKKTSCKENTENDKGKDQTTTKGTGQTTTKGTSQTISKPSNDQGKEEDPWKNMVKSFAKGDTQVESGGPACPEYYIFNQKSSFLRL